MTSLTKITVSFSAVVPHDLVALLEGRILESLIQSVVEGSLPARIEAKLADGSAALAEVHPAVRHLYLARLAADAERIALARSQLSELPLDSQGRLEADFLVWPAGTSFADVSAWFESN
jgi:hypothetical protein